MKNRSIPQCTVIPELAYPNMGEAIEWLNKAFGFTLRVRIGDHRAQMNVGDGAVVLIEGTGKVSEPSHGMLVRVEDARRHYQQAKSAGAKTVREPADHLFGERQYTVEDLAGHRWTFSQSIADVAPEEWGGVSGKL